MSPEAGGAAGLPPVHLRMVFCAEPMAVRAALRRLVGDLERRAVPAEARGAAEIVLAEALNNIVEHAYAERGGEIDILLEPEPSGLRCAILDRGAPMPGLALPAGNLPDTAAADTPEGGFGWFLIRNLAFDLRYDRVDGINRLTFRLPAGRRADNAHAGGAAVSPPVPMPE
jgi:serine/threonine-protein kinase RsbW